MSPPGALGEFSSPRPSPFWFCINIPITELKCLMSDSEMGMKLGEDVRRQQHPRRSGKTQRGAGSELARFAGHTRFMPKGSG